MPNPVRLLVDEGVLRVLAPRRSAIHEGRHFIYLVNVLGLEPLEAPESGYKMDLGPSQQALLTQIADYFSDKGFDVGTCQ